MENKEEFRNLKRQMFSNIEGFIKDFEGIIKKEVEHKHQISLQCARDGMKATCIDVLKRNKTLSHKLKQNLIEEMKSAS